MSTPSDRISPLILVVDDDPVARMQLRLCLENEGYHIAEAKDGATGLAVYGRLQPDIVLLDALMPGLDGFECCIRLQSLPRGRQIPILMITGLNDQDSVDRAFAVGAADYVTKPVHWAVLRQRVRRLIQQSQLQQQLEAANRELRRLASVDGLTQVANRRQFDELLAQEWLRCQQEQQPLALLLCDIDCFKPYNDTYGHQAGDRCLQQVAQALKTAAHRPADLVARYGGEEFAILLPNTNREGALCVAERMNAHIKALNIPHHRSSVGACITVSIGAASIIPALDFDAEILIATADQALYHAKHYGRDRCCFYNGNPTLALLAPKPLSASTTAAIDPELSPPAQS